MVAALATYSPADPAWTHTGHVAQLHNLGGVTGAWFADISLYFFGYSAYLLPLGVVFGGWRLFKCGMLLDLDAEVVLFRVLGFAVALATACGLAAVHLSAVPGAMPGDGSAGGLVGAHVGRFLIRAFGFAGGNLFMAALLLAGFTLGSGLSWLVLVEGLGSTVLKAMDWVGGLILAPLRWSRSADDSIKPPPDPAPVEAEADAGTTPAAVTERPDPGARLRGAATRLLNRWRSRRASGEPTIDRTSATNATGGNSVSAASVPMADATPPSGKTEAVAPSKTEAMVGARPSARIEPVLNLSPRDGRSHDTVAAVPAPVDEALSRPTLDMLTLVPVAGVARNPIASRPLTGTLPPVTPSAPAWTDRPMDTGFAGEATSARVVSIGGERFARAISKSHPVASAQSDLAPEEQEVPDEPESPPPFALASHPAPRAPASLAPVATLVRRVAAPSPTAPPHLLPSLDLLDRPPARTAGYSSETLVEMSRRVEVLLKSFGIEAQVVAVEPGPVITRFEVEPAPGVKVSQISNLAKDLARGLSVIGVRVVEIIPGKSVIGLEIPNRHREIVYLREVLEAPVYTQSSATLTLSLGKDIGGNPVVANLNKMPHLLVAGTTGSGKSVAINAMLLSLLYKASPSEVRLILVDPKMLELSIYEDIPHLLTPVVTDMKEAANALRWCVAEMERRYRLMATLKVRNIAGFNRKVLDALATGEGLADPFWTPECAEAPGEIAVLQPLPFIVVVIDELADMMMIVGKKVEELIARLAQKARAAGIHLILATQRPSVDVITGLIKANIPTRVAFQVSSRVDSRTILDQMGAEQLLGHGDMLYLPPGTGLPQRVHGAFVDDHEVNRVVDFLRQTGAPDYIDDVLAEPREESDNGNGNGDGEGRGGESDPLYDEAVRIVTESRRASVSGVQRRLRIGYNRAARLVEEMESAGVVGPLQSNGSREVIAPPPP
ncbi:MAG: DNA translocase FtsK 4TM domain-containing protein [Candidatus Competibacter sp.]|nr:DNA translocase FtsK 4TM domain-containing protein [Candidatus Competibacter sp.]MDG4585245.1 DNA translocase FtsK 4TM domain-containing protein [Candidatus Competibacter sp.]